ncbi:hypothetical protein ARGLB_008_01460 [Arthrobacter globiformis NBRC 12137]|uniref:Uncharacterized protein n=1 Tax=Arthrobacter globiformis (strain ATCC 8010 / DSM 20124 / JCM 1332 / NBRC 12137 / NCIMB 8907 / NRRL B-2979 / 168) TaxID=1077972 RepID=H0QH22_ARTG1|nr:hypothetical protein ARGLB_008_01460 [Arthrobacter globiformis NBRC 12137]
MAVEPGVSWDMVNLIIHRSLLRGAPVPAVARRTASGNGPSRTNRKELFRNQTSASGFGAWAASHDWP